jgi:hypothetical protein
MPDSVDGVHAELDHYHFLKYIPTGRALNIQLNELPLCLWQPITKQSRLKLQLLHNAYRLKFVLTNS